VSESHYLPWFTTHKNGRLQQTACGIYISRDNHTAEPTCPQCAAWLVRDAEDLNPEDVFGPPPDVFPPIERRPEMTDGYQPKRGVR